MNGIAVTLGAENEKEAGLIKALQVALDLQSMLDNLNSKDVIQVGMISRGSTPESCSIMFQVGDD